MICSLCNNMIFDGNIFIKESKHLQCLTKIGAGNAREELEKIIETRFKLQPKSGTWHWLLDLLPRKKYKSSYMY